MTSVGATIWLPDTESFFGELSVIITLYRSSFGYIEQPLVVLVIFYLYRTSLLID